MMPIKGGYVTFKNYERKIKSPFVIFEYFESILVPEDNKKQNPKESYMKKYQKHIAWSYGCKWVCVEKLVMSNEDNEDFENSTKCWICELIMILKWEVIVISLEKEKTHRNCNINVELNHKISVVFCSLLSIS